jgi:hypothetical protein
MGATACAREPEQLEDEYHDEYHKPEVGSGMVPPETQDTIFW